MVSIWKLFCFTRSCPEVMFKMASFLEGVTRGVLEYRVSSYISVAVHIMILLLNTNGVFVLPKHGKTAITEIYCIYGSSCVYVLR